MLISILLLLSLKTIRATKWQVKNAQENYLKLHKKLVDSRLMQEQNVEKNAYLERYNKSLMDALFEITKELLLTKKSILEASFN
ncbi:MAG: hypothetical protein CMP05_05290 [Xanthomarina sp.]|uniref:Uncharacterized protein n=2 Tax=Xanthomarina TaxID=1868329 RepID=A0A3D6BV16_9FLAO|nr:hypothetical protein [Xanthomarina sp.]MBF61398.1 hypothetical protein [Xanthomarina sp.]HAB27888.1 hypothetical protein [Xanthomarina gelatinilytica]HCY83073.1 hypothetical protein [Xanthomarina gelatinilytica]|tara:strand:- start:2519 stop:2770 length:252 start_codon:yes stop_codon:yes gene_type:complete